MKCDHLWVMRVSQDGLLYIRFCGMCLRAEHLNQDKEWSTMRYAKHITRFDRMLEMAEADAAKLPAWKKEVLRQQENQTRYLSGKNK